MPIHPLKLPQIQLLPLIALAFLVAGCAQSPVQPPPSITNTLPEVQVTPTPTRQPTTPAATTTKNVNKTPSPLPTTQLPTLGSPFPTAFADISYPVRQSGYIVLVTSLDQPDNIKAYFDLDAGKNSIADGDIHFAISRGSATFFALDPVNGAKATFVGVSDLSFQECNHSLDLFTEGSNPEISIGSHFCLFTNQGQLAQIRIGNLETVGHIHYLDLDIITWEKPITP